MESSFRAIRSACLADWGPAIETAARRIAVLVAFAYAAGYVFGVWLHQASARLAAAYVALLGLAEPVVAAGPVAAEPVVRPEVCSLTVLQLRKLARARGIKAAGGRRIAQATKAALLEALI